MISPRAVVVMEWKCENNRSGRWDSGQSIRINCLSSYHHVLYIHAEILISNLWRFIYRNNKRWKHVEGLLIFENHGRSLGSSSASAMFLWRLDRCVYRLTFLVNISISPTNCQYLEFPIGSVFVLRGWACWVGLILGGEFPWVVYWKSPPRVVALGV